MMKQFYSFFIKLISFVLITTITTTESKCINSSLIVAPVHCKEIIGDREIFIQDGPEFFISSLTGFNIDQATHKSLFLPKECRKALIPFICGSGYQECYTTFSDDLQSEVTLAKPLCRSVCENVADHCAEIFEANGQLLPNCSLLNNRGSYVTIPLTTETKFVECFSVDTTVPAPDFIYDCPWPFLTTNDGCIFRCPAPITDDRDESDRFESTMLWTRRLFYFPVYVVGLIFFGIQIWCFQYWSQHPRLLVFVLKGFLVWTNVWNLIGMRSISDPICNSQTEIADIKNSDCIAQTFFISSFAGIGWTFFWIATKYLYEFYYAIYKKKWPMWFLYCLITIGILMETVFPIIILTTESYSVAAVTCGVDFNAKLGEFKHFYFWMLNGPETVDVYLGFIVVLGLVAFTIKTCFDVYHLTTKDKWKRLLKRTPFITFLILFGVVIAIAQYTTLSALETNEIAKSAEEWATCLIVNMINGIFFDTKDLPQPTCSWDDKIEIWVVVYGILSPAFFDIVLMVLFAKSLYAGIQLKIRGRISSKWNSQTSTPSQQSTNQNTQNSQNSQSRTNHSQTSSNDNQSSRN